MRYANDHKQATRTKVLEAAARVIRQNGPDRVAVAGVMAEVGLTHGGFYAHFDSKDDLLVQAIGQMFQELGRNFAATAEGLAPHEALRRYINFYLSAAHRDHRDTGCPLPALSADLPRLTQAARVEYAKGVAGLTRRLAKLLTEAGKPDAEALASSILAEMVGAVALARSVPDPAQSDAILRHSRHAVRERAGLNKRDA
jgi:TetR/AcrR family transcriptional repressor of nem operon